LDHDKTSATPLRKLNGTPWQAGQSGNLHGRPIGARGKFSQQFVADLSAAWDLYGADALAQTAKLYPDRFVGICSHLIPKDVQVSLTAQLPAGLDPDDWTALQGVLTAVRQAFPDHADRKPEAVLEHVLEALRAHDAKVIEGDKNCSKHRFTNSCPGGPKMSAQHKGRLVPLTYGGEPVGWLMEGAAAGAPSMPGV